MADGSNNLAAYLDGVGERPLTIAQGPDQSTPGSNELIIKVAALAVCPIDCKHQNFQVFPLDYPHILGHDVSGTVVKIGSDVTRFHVGDRVIATTWGDMGRRYGGFQQFVTTMEHATAPIPDSLVFEQASVLPSSLLTAIQALYGNLKLELPILHAQESAPTGKGIVVVWGGSSTVGVNIIQLATAAGYDIVSTASKKNHKFVSSLKAQGSGRHIQMFDQSEQEIVEKIIKYVEESKDGLVGVIDCIGETVTNQACAKILKHFGGGLLPSCLPPIQDLPEGVTAVFVLGDSLGKDQQHPGTPVWRDYLIAALEDGRFRAEPPATVFEGGFDSIQEAMDTLWKGVSATKIVVKL